MSLENASRRNFLGTVAKASAGAAVLPFVGSMPAVAESAIPRPSQALIDSVLATTRQVVKLTIRGKATMSHVESHLIAAQGLLDHINEIKYDPYVIGNVTSKLNSVHIDRLPTQAQVRDQAFHHHYYYDHLLTYAVQAKTLKKWGTQLTNHENYQLFPHTLSGSAPLLDKKIAATKANIAAMATNRQPLNSEARPCSNQNPMFCSTTTNLDLFVA